jgi:hypothetical protein
MLNGTLKKFDVRAAALALLLVGGLQTVYVTQSAKAAGDSGAAVTYWIELVRDGKTSHVNQKAPFLSGDKIKFHVKPSIDGYAYVALKSGSQGESSVLFPLPHSKDNNHVAKGVDIAIPSDDFMEFDANPGTEHLCLTLSRTPIEAKSLLGGGMRTDDTKVVMRAQSGSKDLVPAKIKVVYTAPQSAESGSPADSSHGDKTKKYAPAGISYVPASGLGHGEAEPAVPVEGSAGDVTVTQSEPGGMLNIDVDLSHSG